MLYLDCSNGISGDMVVGALIDLGIDKNKIIDTLSPLAEIKLKKVKENGISATDFRVEYSPKKRAYIELLKDIESLKIPRDVKKLAKEIVTTLAKSEAKVHKVPLSKVHLHEAADSVIDAVAMSMALKEINQKTVVASTVSVGRLAPATERIIRSKKIPVRFVSDSEITTPTGVAILANIVSGYGDIPPVGKHGYGMGDKKFDYPNVLRATVGGRLVILETNIDDCTPELLSYTIEKVVNSGALDAHILPCLMKKGRQGFLVRVLTDNPEKFADILMRETNTLGVRVIPVTHRYELSRETKQVKVKIKGKYETVKIKESPYSFKPEFEDVRRLAKRYNLTFREVFEKAKNEYNKDREV